MCVKQGVARDMLKHAPGCSSTLENAYFKAALSCCNMDGQVGEFVWYLGLELSVSNLGMMAETARRT
jgi:hypothetical protein